MTLVETKPDVGVSISELSREMTRAQARDVKRTPSRLLPVSVIIPVRNEAANLARCLESLGGCRRNLCDRFAERDESAAIARSLRRERRSVPLFRRLAQETAVGDGHSSARLRLDFVAGCGRNPDAGTCQRNPRRDSRSRRGRLFHLPANAFSGPRVAAWRRQFLEALALSQRPRTFRMPAERSGRVDGRHRNPRACGSRWRDAASCATRSSITTWRRCHATLPSTTSIRTGRRACSCSLPDQIGRIARRLIWHAGAAPALAETQALSPAGLASSSFSLSLLSCVLEFSTAFPA